MNPDEVDLPQVQALALALTAAGYPDAARVLEELEFLGWTIVRQNFDMEKWMLGDLE